MDDVLKQTIKVVCIVRDSVEAKSWRHAWQLLDETSSDMSGLITAPVDQIPVAAYIRGIRTSDQAKSRPTMFPLLIVKSPFIRSIDQVRNGLREYPEVWNSFEGLRNCMRLVALLVEYLRVIAPGYPFDDLIYSIPGTPWRELSSTNELPWGLGETLLLNKSTDARFIGFHRYIPSVANAVAQNVNELSSAIMHSDTWLSLKQAYDTVSKYPNVAQELLRIKAYFEKELGKIKKPVYPSQQWIEKVEDLSNQVYLKRGQRIKRYIDAFQNYHELVERIYWLLSHILIYEHISSISSHYQDQLQQIIASETSRPILTAISLTGATTMEIGQLLHISLPEIEHLLDGLYQVEQLNLMFQVSTGVRMFFRARRLWNCQLDDLVRETNGYITKTVLESKQIKGGDEYKIDVHGPDGKVMTLEAGNPIIEFNISKSMYLV